ncbi:hypothetical protein FQ377_14600 [Arthrobacter echini]|uniref:Uncharacterized protein n=1 Tax=Arthrobacter echini TaxID=1529066 RepID=A0A5D0XHC2_9MICC|nr:hypothetical protein [Arthrobacter echini]TYC95857.1 hypothetical protein FQ377_14600 [Arthrobacter echini]
MDSTNELLETLRGEIFAAEVKVILDQRLGRETSPTVKKLAAVKLPPRARSHRHLPSAPEQGSVHQTRKEQLLETLRDEIFAAEVKVILDQRLGRETSLTVKRLAAMKIPPAINSNDP